MAQFVVMNAQPDATDRNHTRKKGYKSTDTHCLSFGQGSDAVLDVVLITGDKRGDNYIQSTLLLVVHINRKRVSDYERTTTGVRGKGMAHLSHGKNRDRGWPIWEGPHAGSAMSVFVFLGWWPLVAPDLWSKGGVKVVKVED